MNPDSDKKANEAKCIREWMRVARPLPNGKLMASESPDFLFFISRKKAIGLEFTRLIFNNLQNNGKIEHTITAELFRKKLVELIQKKEARYPLYNSEPLLFEIWLIISCEDDVYLRVHRQLPDLKRIIIDSPFKRIELFFPHQGMSHALKKG